MITITYKDKTEEVFNYGEECENDGNNFIEI